MREMSSREHWRPEEDAKLRRLVGAYGTHNWNAMAESLKGRSGKSCRLRWFNQLDPRINRSPFTAEEEERLLACHMVHGNRWSMIARHFPGRTDNAIKNQWHVIMARKRRNMVRKEEQKASNICSTQEGSHHHRPATHFTIQLHDDIFYNRNVEQVYLSLPPFLPRAPVVGFPSAARMSRCCRRGSADFMQVSDAFDADAKRAGEVEFYDFFQGRREVGGTAGGAEGSKISIPFTDFLPLGNSSSYYIK